MNFLPRFPCFIPFLLAGSSFAVSASSEKPPRLNASIDLATKQVSIAAQELAIGRYELRLETTGLTGIETSKDVNEPGALYLPAPEFAGTNAGIPEAENIFFFNELLDARDWELVVKFPSPVVGSWKLNGRFSKCGGGLNSTLSIPAGELEGGENLLHYQSNQLPAVPVMYYRRSVSAGSSVACTFAVERSDWNGRVLLVGEPGTGDENVVATSVVSGPELVRYEVSVPERWWIDRPALTDAALAVGRNVLSARITRPDSLFFGGFNLVYDAQKKSSRIPHWIWSWGPSIKLLLDLEKMDAARLTGLAPQFHAAAVAAGQRSLAFGVTDPNHFAAGVSTVRWEPSHATPNGWAEYISTADSLFLAGWGWMSLYQNTHERVYLERTQGLVAAAERLMDRYPVVPQDWIVERQRWTPHTLDESVFGMAGFSRLYAETKSAAVASAGQRFLDSHLKHMGGKSGLLQRAWMRDEDKAIWEPDIKGHAWVLEGYLDAYRLSGETKYLDLARSLAALVVSCQSDNGSWTYVFQKPGATDPEDDKATAIWAYLFYDLYRVTHDPQHLAAGRRALGWCLRHQYRGEDPHLDGGIFNSNAMAYIRRRPMTILYSTTFFGLALLEELALPPGS